jgi:hypothetical protein
MSRSGESVTRLDIRFPNEMYNKLQQIAAKDGARTHHISQKVEVSPTVIKLLQFALDNIDGMLSDNNDNISDILSGRQSSASPDNLSDISDKRIEAIVDRRLTELGLFPDCQMKDDSTSHSLPDKVDTVPDTLPDKNAMISDRAASLPDNLSDTKNILSDDSSNFEQVVDDLQNTLTDAIEQVSGEISESYSFAGFHEWLGLPKADRNKANGDVAIEFAKDCGKGDWVMSRQFKFTKQQAGNNQND